MCIHCLLCNPGIIITDLDDSDDEADSVPSSDAAGVSISTALLEHIKGHHTHTSTPVLFPSTRTALVLFRPLSFPAKKDLDDEPAGVDPLTPPTDDDAMDIEQY